MSQPTQPSDSHAPASAVARVRASVARVGVLALVALLWPQVAFALAADSLQGQRARSSQVAPLPQAVAGDAALEAQHAWQAPGVSVAVAPRVAVGSRDLVSPAHLLRWAWVCSLPPPAC